MALLRLFDPTTQFQTKSGALNVAGKLRIYVESTDDLANIYGDDGSRLPQPLILDSNGRARGLFVDSGRSYRLEAYDRNDSLLFTIRRLEPNASGTIVNPTLFIKGTPDEIDVEDSVIEENRTYTVSLSAKVTGKIAENQEAILKESEARKAALDDKVDKVYTATENHIAVFDNAGNIKDSGKTYADMQGEFKRKQTAKSSPTASGNTLSFIDTVSQDAEGVITATKKSVTVDSTYSSSGTNPVNGKAVKAAIDGLDAAITSNDGTNVQVKVTETDGKISAVNITSDNTENRNNKASSWQTTPDNTHYPTEKLVKDSLDGKVDKVEGKGLSTEDYTTAEKTKLDGIAAGTASPLMDGKASVGNSLKYAREDHVHPSDTSREDIANKTTVVLGTSDSKYPTDKAVAEFVNSSIATNTANYISNNGEPFTSVEQLEAYSGPVTNNDYAFVTGIDSEGNTYYDRYKATVSGSTVTWALEYRLNNSSFTAAQWSAINSGITSVLVAKIHEHGNKDVLDGITSDKVNSWNGKEDAFDVLPTTKGGTGTNAASKSALTSSLINSLSTESSTPVDADYYVSQTIGGGTSNTSFVRRPVLALWEYIKKKISSVLGLTATNYSGKAATAGKAIADASGNNIEETYQEKLGASVDASGVVSFPANVCANGSETLATIRYLQSYYSQFPKAGQGIKINTDSDGAPIILVKQWKADGTQLTCQRANPGDLASWRMKNMNFDNMGRMSMISDDYTYMPVPNDFGTAGQLLVSNGDGNAPKWKSGIGLPPIQKGFAYSGSGNSKKYAWLFHICKSSQSGGNDTIHTTFKIYTNTTGSGLSATADVWYRRNNGKQGTTKGQLTWTHGISPSNFTLYANVYDDLSNNININLFAYMGATYQRVEASLDNISSLNSPSTITNANTSLLTDFYSNSFATSLPTLGTNLELK